MQKKTPDYDNVFKTMKMKHKRLFISVINDTFGNNYSMDAKVEILPSEGYLTENGTTDGSKDITEKTPKTTRITFTFPDGQEVHYESENVILEEFTRERIVEKRLFPYIPFYIARYEKDITSEKNIENAAEDLEYFRNEMIRLHKKGELTDAEFIDLMGFVNTIITHITNGNKSEERLVNIMGGTVIETLSEKLIRKGK